MIQGGDPAGDRAPAVKASGAALLRTSLTSNCGITAARFPWRTPDRTPTAASSSSFRRPTARRRCLPRCPRWPTAVSKEVAENYAAVGGTPWLDFKHTVFGQVYDGMDVVDAIAGVAVGMNDKPKADVNHSVH